MCVLIDKQKRSSL